MISLTVTADTVSDLMSQLRHVIPQTDTPAASGPKKSQEESAPKSKAKAAPVEHHEASEPSVKGPITFAQVSEIVPKLVEAAGRPKTIEILGRYGAKKAGELKPEQYAEFMASAKTEIATAEKAKASA